MGTVFATRYAGQTLCRWVVLVVQDPDAGTPAQPIAILPVVVLSKIFPARPSSIPEIREFVRASLADSPLTDADNREITQIVFRALLDAAGPTGTIQISFRIFPEHVEVDVLHSHSGEPGEPTLGALRALAAQTGPAQPEPASFAVWMAAVLRREGLTQEAAARQLGVSVKTVSRWVGGETEPRLRDLRRIQERFGDLPLS
jgi:helix-turn-helix protein